LLRRVVFAAILVMGVSAGSAMGGMEGVVLRDMDGNPVEVDSLLADGPVILNFWATWCRPCRAEMPKLQEVQEELAGRKVHFAAISLDDRRNTSKVEAYVEQNKITLPIYRDPEGTLAKRFQVLAIPTTFVLDQNAEVAYKTRGYRPGDEVLLRKAIEALIEKGDEKGEGKASSE
jgi:cytochrome c biogenesis protein CcmG/thiol:disulfide interchange protein DsbE